MFTSRRTFKSHDQCENDIQGVIGKLEASYSLPQDRVMLESLLWTVWNTFGGFEGIRGKRLLDLGGGGLGSLESRDPHFSAARGVFDPWLARAFSALGGSAVLVDLFPTREERFEQHRIDLFAPGALDCFESASFDAINMNLVLSSPDMAQRHNHAEREELGRILTKERDRLLKPDGLVILWDLRTD